MRKMQADTPALQFPDPLNHAPDRSDTVLILIDVINDLEFDGGEALLVHALPMGTRLAALKRRAEEAGIPVIYANDNFGRWRSNFRLLVKNCLANGVRGRLFVELLVPDESDYFILKPKYSAFFRTDLDLLLKYFGTTRVILTGLAGDRCVLFTANDAYMRDFHVIVLSDCIVSESAENNQQVLVLMERVLKAEVCLSTDIDFARTVSESAN